MEWVRSTYQDAINYGRPVPLFPTESGGFVTKQAMIKHIEVGAMAYWWGGHACRRGIVVLGSLRGGCVANTGIATAFLHSSLSLIGYSHSGSANNVAAEAALGRTLSMVQAEIKSSTMHLDLQKQEAARILGANTSQLVLLLVEVLVPDAHIEASVDLRSDDGLGVVPTRVFDLMEADTPDEAASSTS
jgi:hypothetical protein